MSTHGHGGRSREPTTVSRTKSNLNKTQREQVKKDVPEAEDERRSEKDEGDENQIKEGEREDTQTPQQVGFDSYFVIKFILKWVVSA